MEIIIIGLSILVIIIISIFVINKVNQNQNNSSNTNNSKELKLINDFKIFLQNNLIPINDGISPIILKNNEYLILVSKSDYFEERAIRTYSGVSLRIAKGFYTNTGQSSLNYQNEKIDFGDLILTNERLIFVGTKRTNASKLSDLIRVKTYIDGIVINKSSKQKSEIYIVDIPNLFRILINILTKHKVVYQNNFLRILK